VPEGGRDGGSVDGGRRGVLDVGDGIEPVHDGVVVVALVDGHVDHQPVRGRAVPVLLVGLDEDAVPGADHLDRAAASLAQADALGDENGLAQPVAMPVGAGAGHEGTRVAVTREGASARGSPPGGCPLTPSEGDACLRGQRVE